MDLIDADHERFHEKPDPMEEWQRRVQLIEDSGQHTVRALMTGGMFARGVAWALWPA